jgi:dTDP-4-dehydrorhamnose reductase
LQKSILITGGSGLLGQYLNLRMYDAFKTLTLYNSHSGNCPDFNSAKTDITKQNELSKIFKEFMPDVVVHSAAITNPVIKENQTAKDYYQTNVNATSNIAQLCSEIGAKLIYISTDLVYAGYRGSMLNEDSKLIPASLYAETKLMGEIKVREFAENHLILRTALLYGIGLNHSTCHFQQMFTNLFSKMPVKLFTDQFRTPISLIDASRIITELIDKEDVNGTINLGGTERVSRYEMGEILCNLAEFDKTLMIKSTIADVPGLPKVEDVSMNTEKLRSMGIKQKSIDESIHEMLQGYLE